MSLGNLALGRMALGILSCKFTMPILLSLFYFHFAILKCINRGALLDVVEKASVHIQYKIGS